MSSKAETKTSHLLESQMKTMDVKDETEYKNGREFLMSVNDRLNQMIAAVSNDVTEFKKELRLKEEDRYTETKNEIGNVSQNCLKRDNFKDIPENLLKIYLPDDATIARELWRIKEYAEELDTIKEETKEELNEGNSEEDIKPEFASGAEYLDWLDRQLPYLEPFLPENADHFYFFRRWSRDDFRYFMPCLETHFEEEPRENLKAENDDEDTEPEFANGEEYLGWLGRQLPCLEPFVGDDTIHACYEFEWRKRNDYTPRLNTVVEEKEEELYKGNTEEDIKPEFASGAEYLDWLERRLPFLEPFLPDDEVHEYFLHDWSRDDFRYTPCLETLFEETEKELYKENTEEDIKPEFASGAEYLDWLERRLPFLEPFLPDDEVHEHFFHDWSRNDFRYTPCLETLFEEKEEELYKGNTEEDIKPEFSSGAEYLDWLERQLPFLEPFLPDDEVHEHFLHDWSRDDFRYTSCLETLFEETEEELCEENPEEDIKPEFASGAEYLAWLERQLPFFGPFLPDDEVHEYFFREWSRDDFRYTPCLETLFEKEPEENLTAENNEEDIDPEFASGEEYLGWLGRQLPCLEPFVGDDTIHACYEFEWRKKNDYTPRLDTLIEENEKEEQKACNINTSVKDTRELEDEDVNPYIKLMLQPTVFCMEVLMTKNPLSLVDICTKKIPTELTTDTSQPKHETSLIDTEQQTEQICNKASKWNLSFKFLNRNRKEKEEKKRAPGFFSRFFH